MMGLLGLELSDAGIMVATQADMGLLRLDAGDWESPGFALPQKHQVLVGRAAARNARLYPRQVMHHFWDQLNTEPLQSSLPQAQNHAEVACAHLASIWEHVKHHGDALVMAVPGFFQEQQLGFIVSMAEELSIPLQGFVTLPIAASAQPCPERMLLHLDMHLHRSEVAFLEQDTHLTQRDTTTAFDTGLQRLYAEWVHAIAEEFVRSTRFDPLHQASHEQELYDRLPHILAALQRSPSVQFDMTAGRRTYGLTIPRELLVERATAVFQDIRRLLTAMREHYRTPGQAITVQVTQRITRLPGYQQIIADIPESQIVELAPGSSALGVIHCWQQLSSQATGRRAVLFTSRPWHAIRATTTPALQAVQPGPNVTTRPTHVLYRSLAYTLSDQPLLIGRGDATEGIGVRIQGELAGVSRTHCALQLRDGAVILTDHSTYGTFVDTTRIVGTARVQLGQVIRVGTPGEELQLIACVDAYEA